MAVGSMNVEEGTKAFPAKLTFQVFLCCVIAAVGGLMFGYDIGISGLCFKGLNVFKWYQLIN